MLTMEALNLVELALLKSDPLRDPLVTIRIRLSRNPVVVSPVRSPMSNGHLCHGVRVSLGSVKLVYTVEPNLAEVVARRVEAVIAGLGSLEPTIGVSGGSRVVSVVVLEDCHQLGLHHRVSTIIVPHAPVNCLFRVSWVDDFLAQTRRAWLRALERDLGRGSCDASDFCEGRGLDSARDAIDNDLNVVQGVALETPALDFERLTTGGVATNGRDGIDLGVRLDVPAIVTGEVAVL